MNILGRGIASGVAAVFLLISQTFLAGAATNQGRIWSSGFELNSITADMEVEATGGAGTIAVVTSPVRTGTYALQTSRTGTAGLAWARYRFAESNSTGPFYFRFYLRVADYPDTTANIIALDATGGGDRAGIQMTSTGALRLADLDGTGSPIQVGSDSAVLSLNTWYRVEMLYDASAGLSSVTLSARLDGTQFASSSSITNGSSVGRVTFGGVTSIANYEYYWDDVAINTTTWPGSGSIVMLRPNAAGDNSGWTIGAGAGSNYEQVDEVIPDDATTYLSDISSTGLVTDDYNIASATGLIPEGAAIGLVSVGVRGGGTGTTARTFVTRIKASSSGTVEESSSIDWSFNGWRTNREGPTAHNYVLTLYDLPGASTSDWTITDLDSAQIGVRHDALSINEVRLSTIWLLVDYSPSVGNPVPTTTSIVPTSKTVGDVQFTMTVNGTNFADGVSTVRLDGSDRATTFVSSSQLTATIPASDMTVAGVHFITVFNAAPGGGTSNAQTFTVNNPAPGAIILNPSSKSLNSAEFTLTVDGSDFVADSVVRFDGVDKATTFVSSSQLTATVPASDLTVAGTYPITVFSPAPGGGESLSADFVVNNPVPAITLISPTSKAAGSAEFTLDVSGTDFLTTSVVRFNGVNKTTIFVNGTALQATIPASDLGVAGNFGVAVFNPAPGGGLSNSATFTVSASGAGGGASVGTTYLTIAERQREAEKPPEPPLITGFINAQFVGRTFPSAKLVVTGIGEGQEVLARAEKSPTLEGDFKVFVVSAPAGVKFYKFIATDPSGAEAFSKVYFVTPGAPAIIDEEMLIPPSATLSRILVVPGESLTIKGWAFPGGAVEVEIDGERAGDAVIVKEDGSYSAVLETKNFLLGRHSARVRGRLPRGEDAGFSLVKTFDVVREGVSGADLTGDKIVDIRDWSVFLSLWSSKDAPQKLRLDLNNDGKVDISDFSVFVQTLRGRIFGGGAGQ